MMTSPAVAPLSSIHHRTPVILDPANWDAWLDPATTPDEASALLEPPVQTELELVAVSTAVNKVANDGPEIQQPMAAAMVAAKPEPRRRAKTPDSSSGGRQGSLFD